MKNRLVMIALISVLAAVVVVFILKYLGQGNPTVIGGGVAGGIAGAISANLLNKKKQD